MGFITKGTASGGRTILRDAISESESLREQQAKASLLQTGVPGVANDPTFAIRIVNAATGTNCLDTTGALYNSANGGDWTLDNVAFQGVSFDTVASWPFDNLSAVVNNTPVPAISNNTATANKGSRAHLKSGFIRSQK